MNACWKFLMAGSLILITIITYVVILMARNTDVLQSYMLCGLQSKQQLFSFQCPKGRDFSLAVGVPSGWSGSSLQLSGTVSLSGGPRAATNLLFDTSKSIKGDWLADRNLNSFYVTLRAGSNDARLDNYLTNNAFVAMHLNLSTNLKGGTLWLRYVTKWKNRE